MPAGSPVRSSHVPVGVADFVAGQHLGVLTLLLYLDVFLDAHPHGLRLQRMALIGSGQQLLRLAGRLSEAASNSCVWRAWRASLSATASFTRLEKSACIAVRVTAGAGAVACGMGRVREKTTRAAESMAAEAKPNRAAEPHSASQPRRNAEGWKTGSDTKPMRCGISSSGSASRAVSVPHSRSRSSRQLAQVLTWTSVSLRSFSARSLK